ncbi:MAG: zinc-binding dehydrogenase [Propionibacteriaceae bacterium]|nr:zinc-binding dehydrogenase [Propionibacteriaceae bacterium]
MRVTHASVGVTDAMAVRGDYLLRPGRGFVPGYDFVGTVQSLPPGGRGRLRIGQRVAGVRPEMGAQASLVRVPPSLLAPLPDRLDSSTAATIPLDAVTAWFALDALALRSGTVLVQGAGGAVGAWAAQLAAARGLTVFGTASPRSRAQAERFASTVFDYRDGGWIDQLLDASGGGVDGVIDHTGDHSLRRVVRPGGRLVRTAFGGAPGAQRAATAAGFLTSSLRRWARPDERICSTPILVATRRERYRQALTGLLAAVDAGQLVPPRPRSWPFDRYAEALAASVQAVAGEKTIIVLPES